MGTTADKLAALAASKAKIDAALTARGITPPTKFADYGDAIMRLSHLFDAEVSYLESTGTQYIDTGLPGSTPMRVKIRFSISPDGTTNNSLFGAFSTNNRLMIYLTKLSNGKNRIQLGCGTKSGGSIGLEADDNAVHEVVANFEADNLWAEVDGGTRVTISGATAATNSTSAFIFNRSGSTNPIKARVYSASIWTGSSMSLVRDYIPVRKSGVGHMFDLVSGSLFSNAGTGAFTIGET